MPEVRLTWEGIINYVLVDYEDGRIDREEFIRRVAEQLRRDAQRDREEAL
jgi:hypothetical protein